MNKLKRFTNKLITDLKLNPEFVVTNTGNEWDYGDLKGYDEWKNKIYNIQISIRLDNDPDSIVDSFVDIRANRFEIHAQFFNFDSLKLSVNAILKQILMP